MEYLQETLFGEKSAVSSNILSLSQNISIAESERVFLEFYESHKDVLDVAYKLSTKSGITTTISVVGSESLPEGSSNARIYVLSPERASDPAVIAGVGRKARDLQLRCKISDLSKSGYSVNPLLDPDMTVNSQKRLFGPLFAAGGQPKGATSAPPAPTKQVNNGRDKTVQKNETASPAVKKGPVPPVKTENKNTASGKSNRDTKPTENKRGAFPFAKVDKTEALKSARKTQALPVSEKVVFGDVNDEDDEKDYEKDEKYSKEKAALQMKNLESSLYDDNNKTISKNDNTEENNSDIEEASQDEQVNEDDLEGGDMEMDMEPIKGIEEENSGDSSEPANKAETKAEQDKEDQESLFVSNSKPEPSTEDKNSNPTTTPKKRTRRVLKTIVTQDEDGFDIRKTVYVDEEMDENDEEATAAPPQPKIPKTQKTTEKPAPAAQNNPDNSKPVKKSKTPPTIKKGNQTSLMSFFKSK